MTSFSDRTLTGAVRHRENWRGKLVAQVEVREVPPSERCLGRRLTSDELTRLPTVWRDACFADLVYVDYLKQYDAAVQAGQTPLPPPNTYHTLHG